MKWTGLYFIGFALLATAVLLALWKLGVLAMLGSFWTGVIVLMMIGIGIMVAVVSSGRRRVEIDQV